MIIEIEKIEDKAELFHHLLYNGYKSIYDCFEDVVLIENDELEYIKTILNDRNITYKVV